MEERYIRQSELVVRCIPSIAEESCFAIKGGTAINLFELDLPRLSVDIDLTFLPVTDRDTAIREINAALVRIAERLKARGLAVRMRGTEVSRKMACFANGAEIKIEPNFILRGTVYPVRQLRLVADISAALAREDRERLVAFTALEADADVFGISGLEKLPAIIWKRRNLETLRRKDARKFADNALALERMLL